MFEVEGGVKLDPIVENVKYRSPLPYLALRAEKIQAHHLLISCSEEPEPLL